MRSVIQQSEVFPAPAEALFEMYLDAKEHAAITGGPVEIGAEAGAKFSAFGGMLSGTMLAVVHHQLIVQSWRSGDFKEGDADSTLILSFREEAGEGRIDLVQLDVPEHDYEGVTKGWPEHYWGPWRKLLESRRR
jgi:activator of HSP90 ATPase